MTEYTDAAEQLADAASSNQVELVRQLLIEHADRLILMGDAAAVVAAGDRFPQLRTDRRSAERIGLAKLVVGNWHGAVSTFQATTPDTGSLPASLAWRAGLTAFLQADLRLADSIFRRGEQQGESDADTALLLAWSAIVQADLGDADRARRSGFEALRVATRSADQTALATVHAVVGHLATDCGDWRTAEAHLALSREAVERVGDVPASIRLALNRGIILAARGALGRAYKTLEDALELVEETGYRVFRPRVLHELGVVLARRGRHEEALSLLFEARTAYESLNSWGAGLPLTAIGHVYRRQGDISRARAVYEEAVEYASKGGDVQALSLAKAGLARVRAADDLAAAAALAESAICLGGSAGRLEGLIARGWIAVLAGRQDEARASALEALELAKSRRDQPSLAEALELQASATLSGSAALIADASGIWTDLEDRLGIARTALMLAKLRGDRAALLEQGRALLELGVRSEWTGMADGFAVVRLQPALRIDALGKFQVVRDGSIVAVGEWQSKKARDLLKILLARRGSPITRDELHGLLWPDDAHLASNRLSVVLTVLRTVLDGSRADKASNPAIVSDRNIVSLDLSVADIDVERFITQATEALHAREVNDPEALRKLQTAATAYTGDFCAEDAYEPWAQPMREELSALHISVLRSLADAAREAEQVDLASRSLLALLRREPYDESAYLDLINISYAAGHYGDARRHYRRYADHMTEIGIRPEPFPGLQNGPIHNLAV